MACRSSDNVVFKGDASATVDLDAEMNLSTCEMNHLEVQIVIAPAMAPLAPAG